MTLYVKKTLEVFMKLKNKLITAMLSALLITGSVGAATTFPEVTAVAASTTATVKVAAPTKITTKAASDSITLSWTAVKGADGYRVSMYNSKTKKYQKYKDVIENTCTVTGLKASTTYKFKVTSLVFTEQKTSKVVSAKTSKSGGSVSDKNVGTDKSIKLSCSTKLPAEYGQYFSGKWTTRSRIDDYTYSATKNRDGTYGLKITLKGETVFWDNEEDTERVGITVYDSEGYAIKSNYAYRDIKSKGKFKDLTVNFYNLSLDPGKISFDLSDYGYGDKPKSEDEKEDKLNGCTIDLPTVPQTISVYDYRDNITSSCKVTAISCEVDGDDLIIYFSGKKTYDSKGSERRLQDWLEAVRG